MKRLVAAAVVLLCAPAFAACSDSGSGTDPVEVEVGEAFTWNDYAVEDGWAINGVDRTVDMEQVTTPEVSGIIVNKAEETRTALFQLVFSIDGDSIATVNCSAPEMIKDQSMKFVCPGINTVMPDNYDAVVVQEYAADDGGSKSTSDS